MLKYHIQTVELSSAQTAIQFNSIPQSYDDLYVVWSTRYVSESTTKTSILFNGLSSNFSYRLLQGDGSSAAVGSNTLALGGINNGSNTTANTFSNNQMLVSNYRSNIAKSYSVSAVSENNAATSFQDIWAGLWNNSAPITSLTLFGSSALAIGSSVSLYGIRRGDDKITKVAPIAIGGTVTTSGGYTIHTFTSSGTFSVNRDFDAEYLVIAGGGGGGQHPSGAGAGGGGAGGYRLSVPGEFSGGNSSSESKLFLSSGSYTVIVGAGGAAGSSSNGISGGPSVFASIVSDGGGGGTRGNVGTNGIGGGSGGGAGSDSVTRTGGIATANQGSNGGSGGSYAIPTYGGGGGGGAGAAGISASGEYGSGGGGAGLSSLISGSSVARAGGGGGGGNPSAPGGIGGGGNGGTGSNTGVSAGTANTGGGGGGAYGNGTAAAGGSGIVIIRYLTP